mmetsp:Transcript_139990/g.363859  ORF Transcript_139990/g.363859 Transcript_139990/m.363859 type:complete len:268 (+) Transcript_139990:382-1185(+)
MVFDIYRGGDMFNAAERHLRSSGHITTATVKRLARQMLQGIEWLHQNSVVHRDIKAENFLLDRVDLEDPECHVYLSDFGTAVEISPEERLDGLCGTEIYWAPERYVQSYAFKVDVWAAGVITYILMTHRFPFASKKQIRRKRIVAPSECCEAGASFLMGALARNEDERLTASEALAHPFVAFVDSAAHATDDAETSLSPKVERSDSGSADESTTCGTPQAASTAAADDDVCRDDIEGGEPLAQTPVGSSSSSAAAAEAVAGGGGEVA